MPNWDQGVERVSVGPHTLNEENKERRLDETMADDTELETPGKQATYRTPKGVVKQLDNMLVKRKHMCCSRDAAANYMIHMGRDRRSVMAQFVITASQKEVSQNTHSEKKNIPTAEITKSQDDGKLRSDEAN